jgi:hypothetical protein
MLFVNAIWLDEPRRRRRRGGAAGSVEFVVGDFGVVFGIGAGTGTIQELDVVGNDFITVALDAFAIGPLTIVDAAADRDEHALLGMFRNYAAKAVEARNAVPFSVLGSESASILEGLALAVALGAGGAKVEKGDVGAAIGGVKLGVGAQIADEKNDVCHVEVSIRCRRDHPVDSPGKALEAAQRTRKGQPRSKAWSGQSEGQHGPWRLGVAQRRRSANQG